MCAVPHLSLTPYQPDKGRDQLVHVMLNFAGIEVRQNDLFSNENFFSRGKSALKGLKVSFVLDHGLPCGRTDKLRT
jgi:hypothetical protein